MVAMNKNFLNLYNLFVDKGLKPAQVATAIESQGIWHVDRFGRLNRHTKDSAEAKRALDLVAAQYEHGGDPETPVERDHGNLGYFDFGWYDDDVAEFNWAESNEVLDGKRLGKGARADRRVLGVVVRLVKGQISGHARHPAYDSSSGLAELLVSAFSAVPGIGRSSLLEKFKEAEDELGTHVGLPPVEESLPTDK